MLTGQLPDLESASEDGDRHEEGDIDGTRGRDNDHSTEQANEPEGVTSLTFIDLQPPATRSTVLLHLDARAAFDQVQIQAAPISGANEALSGPAAFNPVIDLTDATEAPQGEHRLPN